MTTTKGYFVNGRWRRIPAHPGRLRLQAVMLGYRDGDDMLTQLANARKVASAAKTRVSNKAWRMRSVERVKSYGTTATYGFGAFLLMQVLWKFQGGRCYLTGEPLEEGFALDHCHDTDRVRGLVNDSANRLLGSQCGDSIVGCRKRLLRLKDTTGPLGTFIKLAIPALMNTPMVQMEFSFRVTGSAASLPESKVNRDIITEANMITLGQYLTKIEDAKAA